jgi:hypothetical protein
MSWFERDPVLWTVVQAHWASDPRYRGRWLTRRIVNEMFEIYEYADASCIAAQMIDPLTCRLLKKLGFKQDGEWLYKMRKDHHGWYTQTGSESADGRSTESPGSTKTIADGSPAH